MDQYVTYQEFKKVFDFIKQNTEQTNEIATTVKLTKQSLDDLHIRLDRVETRLTSIEDFLQLEKTRH
jgi:hypothetical protein